MGDHDEGCGCAGCGWTNALLDAVESRLTSLSEESIESTHSGDERIGA